MTRKESREQAFILLFEYSFSGDTAEELFSVADEAGVYNEDDYCKDIVTKTIDACEDIDEIIGKYSKGWSASRISKVALAAMRLAITEINCFDDIPNSVSINEAVELIKKYATEQDASFANGILGSFVRGKEE
jgi:N utilization substance protein B